MFVENLEEKVNARREEKKTSETRIRILEKLDPTLQPTTLHNFPKIYNSYMIGFVASKPSKCLRGQAYAFARQQVGT